MSATAYSPIQKALHWTLFILILAIYGLTYGDSLFQRGDPTRDLAWWLHISFGLLLAGLVLWRVGLRLSKGAPRLPSSMGDAEQALAKAAHLALYALLIAIPLLGILLTWFRGDALSFFGWFTIPAPFSPDRDLARSIKGLHNLFANGILIIVGIHGFAALWHHFVRKDDILKRMLPAKSNLSPEPQNIQPSSPD
ncbi:cytochrome b [Phyllobacterium zundukense]|uniref:Cytochrome B n=1 Tax=Phyllobacterium zundukense TaxID=1867719 RepID=A0A2N9W237_9HYPH|nr:cytochrome b [Phyllobacterium zundukense]PIO45805.1 cytochrome B [Phyllobacterium zundukense]